MWNLVHMQEPFFQNPSAINSIRPESLVLVLIFLPAKMKQIFTNCVATSRFYIKHQNR